MSNHTNTVNGKKYVYRNAYTKNDDGMDAFRKQRKCLTCSKQFMAIAKFNFICSVCNEINSRVIMGDYGTEEVEKWA